MHRIAKIKPLFKKRKYKCITQKVGSMRVEIVTATV